ncbi:MAG: cadherin-like domain-containing protein, partial [Actinobacteria bacterium]|nr:cadherin-like domain-containing protein [Actinomycetota bacterium]
WTIDVVVDESVVPPANLNPVAGDDSYTTGHDAALTVGPLGVLGNDSDPDGDPVVADSASDPFGGSVVLNADGSFIYTPDPGFSGNDRFTYFARDGKGGFDRATVTVAVAEAPPPPPPEGLGGSAYGYHAILSLFGGPPDTRGPAPSVTLPPTGGAESAEAPSGEAVFGPAVIFESGPLSVATSGTQGPPRSVTSSADVRDGGPGPLTFDRATSTCSANEGGVVETSTTLENALVATEHDPNTGEPTDFHSVPPEPPAGYTVEGTMDHVTSGDPPEPDRYRVVFNEQELTGDSVVVNAAHMYLLGPTAVGDLIVGRSYCDLDRAVSPPAGNPDAYSTDEDTTLTVPAPGVLANDTDAEGDAITAASASDPANGNVT